MEKILPNSLLKAIKIPGKRYLYRNLLQIAAFLFLCIILYLGYHVVFSVGIWYGHPYVSKWCKYKQIPRYALKHEPDEITIVTALFDLGLVKKGHGVLDYHSPYKYKEWVRPFSKLTNPVVIFVEDDEIAKYVRSVRHCLPKSHTRIIKVSREELWAFSLLEKTRKIFEESTYPKHYPYTTNPEFSCLIHAKYEFLLQAVKKNYFKTPYFAWVDITMFKKLDESGTDVFKMLPPEKFNREKVGFTQVGPHDPHLDLDFIMMYRAVWVSGSMVLGTNQTLSRFIKRYKSSVEYLLDKGLANTDEHVIYSMYTTHMKKPGQVGIHTYRCHQGQLGLTGKDSFYFCLGYLCKATWENIHAGSRVKTGL
ncbi:hypothetical protein LOTGIDRAFT_162529 [Lottia gigantea]|uniref:Uncharacterized protein n=1 Tax=Lottia gigantea TaxID=225164 RepID=V3ZML5_LOTGI|nr:hypothetical protein LOTGIDRAFT_162529 [Lottia gigantea]ESO92613.1 hypothetical protein LOTGIDRAFT_162529 [Lottia gigantea]